jgi:hypothetical protein
MKSERQKIRPLEILTLAMTCAILLPAGRPAAAQVMDFSSVPSALTVADAERFFAARANIVTRYNACRRKLLVELYRDELDFTTVAIAKLEAGGTCPGEVPDVNAELGRFMALGGPAPAWQQEVQAAAHNRSPDNIQQVRDALMRSKLVDGWELGSSSDQDIGPINCTRVGELDVALRGLITILYRYPDKLGQNVYNHVLKDILAPKVSGPHQDLSHYSLCTQSIPETENHLLMIDSSRYLTNQLLGIDNESNGYNAWMRGYLRGFLQNDFSEYNARPYQTYSTMALQNLYDFARDPGVKAAAQMVLDYISAKFAVSSSGLRRDVPFRRRKDHLGTALFDGNSDPQTYRFMMLAGITRPPGLPGAYQGTFGRDDMQLAAVTTYRIPDLTLDLIVNKWRNTYYQRIRHAGAELFWNSPQALITAGGIWIASSHSGQCTFCGDEFNGYQDIGQELATTLMPAGEGQDAKDLIQIIDPSRGTNLCVAPGFACGRYLGIPPGYLVSGCYNVVDGGGRPNQNGPWWFIDASGHCNNGRNLGLYIAAYNAQPATQAWQLNVALPVNNVPNPGLVEVAPSAGMDFANFQNRVLSQNGSRNFQTQGLNEYVTVAGRDIKFVPYTVGPNYWHWAIQSIDGRPESSVYPLADGDIINSCEHNPCQPGDGHNGFITIDNPVWGKRLILDLHDPTNPQRAEIDLKSQNSSGAVARTPNHLDAFWVASNGSIASTWWDDNFNNARWNPTFTVSPPDTARVIAPNATPVASVARLPNHLDIFWVGSDGSVGSNWWDAAVNKGAWNQPFSIAPPNSARWNSPVVAVARTSNHLDVFWIAPDGSISSAWWDGNFNNGRWNPPFSLAPPRSAGPESGIAAVARTLSHLDVFWVAGDGSVATNWWDANANGGRWNNPYTIAPPNAARINSPVTAIARTPGHLDVFWIDNASGISTNWWDANFNNGRWNSPFLIAPVGSASAASGLAALARFRDHIDVFWVGGDGSVGSTWWDAGFNSGRWNTPFSLAPPGSATVTSPVSAVARTPDHIDVFWLGRDGSVNSNWWDVFANNARWNSYFSVSAAGAAAMARLESSNDYAAARTPDHLDVFWTVSDGEVFSKWWDGRVNNGRWNGVFSLFTLPAGPATKPNLNSAEMQGDPASLSGGTNPVGLGGKLKGSNPRGPAGPPGQSGGNSQAAQNAAEELNWLARPNSPVAAVARTPDHLDVFWINKQGQIWSDWGDSGANNFWNTKFDAVTPSGVAGPESALTALARRPDVLDVFWVGNDGGVWSNFYNGRWNTPFSISPGTQLAAQKPPLPGSGKPAADNPGQTPPLLDRTARPNSPLTAVSRTPDQLDVFWISKEGQIWSNWWDGQINRGAWNTPFNINAAPSPAPSSSKPGTAQNLHSTPVLRTTGAAAQSELQLTPLNNTASPGAGIAAVSRTPDHLDVFWVGNDGLVWSNWWDRWANNGRWNAPFSISQGPPPPTPSSGKSTGLQNIGNVRSTQGVRTIGQPIHPLQGPDRTARPNSPVVAVARTPEHLDVFWIGNDGAIWTTWWDARLNGAAWNAPFQVSGLNAAAQNSVLSVLARMPEHLDVFWTAPDRSVMSNWWDVWVNRAQWNTPFRVWPP